jgi:hypothetical protein
MKKKFDAVAFQRRARAELSEKYLKDREGFLQDLRTARKRDRKES